MAEHPTFRGGYTERRRYLKTDAAVSLTNTGATMLVQGVVRAVGQSVGLQSRQLMAIAEVFRRQLADKSRLREMHEDLGKAAQRSVLASYDQRNRGGAGPYRTTANQQKNIRYAGGRLRAAIAAPSFFQATDDGLRFVNVQVLNKEAKHWHRLNFGAAPQGAGSGSQYQVEWGGLVIAALGFDEGPSPAFFIPRGFWLHNGERQKPGEGVGEFYPVGELPPGTSVRGRPTAKRQTQGIVARNFFDAGLRRIAEDYPVALQDLYREWWNQAKRGRGPLSAVVSAPRPAFQNVHVWVVDA
jgi:hypothetical protein